MAWAIQFDGVNDYLLPASSFDSLNLSEYSIVIEFQPLVDVAANGFEFIGRLGNDQGRVYTTTSGTYGTLFLRPSSGGSIVSVALPYELNDGSIHVIELTRDALGNFTVDLDTVNILTTTILTGGNSDTIGNRRNLTYTSQMYLAKLSVYDDSTKSNLVSNWDADASVPGGIPSLGSPVLIDTIGGNNATGVNMPTDGSAWIDLGGGSGIEVTAGTTNYSYSAQDSTVDLTGEVSVIGLTTNYSYTAINSVIDLTTEIVINGSTTNYLYDSVDANIDLSGLINIESKTTDYEYTAIDSDIITQGTIVLEADTTNYTYNALNATIVIKGPVTINPKNIIRVQAKSNKIIVKRKSNLIRVK